MLLEDVINQVMQKHKNDSARLDPLADYVKLQLEKHGLPKVHGGTIGELTIGLDFSHYNN